MRFGNDDGGLTYNGPFTGVKWCEYRDKGTGEDLMRLECPVKVTIGDETGTVFPVLWFGNGIVDRGTHQGMTQTESSLRTLQAYGLPVNPGDPSDNCAGDFPELLEGLDATVWAETKEDGTVKAYLNSPSRAMKKEDANSMWAKMTGKAVASEMEAEAGAVDDDLDDLGF